MIELPKTKQDIWNLIKDYSLITIGLVFYSVAWAVFLLPYEITTGGTTGIGAIIYYATGFPMQATYFLINAFLMIFAFRYLGFSFCMKTAYSIGTLTFLLWFTQLLYNNADGTSPMILGEGENFMACLLGAAMAGFGLGLAFSANGSTGGTDIIAAIVNKYTNITIGRMIQFCDLVIICSCYIVFHDLKRIIFGLVTLFVIGYVLDAVLNSSRQSVQFLIFSKKYAEIADRINFDTNRGVTVLNGMGWYSKDEVRVLCVLATKRQSIEILRLVKSIDPNAFISQSAALGVFGEGFDKLKIKIKNQESQEGVETKL